MSVTLPVSNCCLVKQKLSFEKKKRFWLRNVSFKDETISKVAKFNKPNFFLQIDTYPYGMCATVRIGSPVGII